MIELQFSAQKSIGSWLIRQFSWSEFSHVDLVLPNGRLLGAKGSGGVAIREPEPCSMQARYQVKAPAKVLDLAQQQLGRPYDWTAIGGFVLRRDWQDPASWFCSELVAWAFEKAGTPLLQPCMLNRITPRDLLLSPLLQRIA